VIEETATVVSTEAGIAELEVVRRATCGACSSSSACGVSLLDRLLGRRPQRLVVTNSLGVRVGDAVVVGVPEGALLKAALAAYLMPLVGLLAGAIMAQGLVASMLPGLGGDTAGLAGGALGFAGALLLLRGYSRRLAADPRYRATLLRREAPAAPVSVGLPGRG
jgi:sigma-E factor negative regulatory protein RseC